MILAVHSNPAHLAEDPVVRQRLRPCGVHTKARRCRIGTCGTLCRATRERHARDQSGDAKCRGETLLGVHRCDPSRAFAQAGTVWTPSTFAGYVLGFRNAAAESIAVRFRQDATARNAD